MIELHRYWYTAQNGMPIGIIKGKDEITEEIKYYIGIGMGFNEDDDAKYIMKWGDKFNLEWFNE